MLTEIRKTDPISPEAESYANYLLCLSLDIGEEMLKSGAEVHRVEDTVERICYACGAIHVEVFAITTLIIAAVRMKDNSYSSQIRRVYNSSYSLSCLEQFNSISRRICRDTPPLEEVDGMIREAKEHRKYPFWLYLLGGCVTAATFTLFFGGSVRDALVALLLGALVVGIDRIHSSYINQLAKLLITSFVAGIFAYLGVFIGVGEHVDSIMIGTIMLLIPGLAFGNALRDLLWGDIMAGIMKTVQACLSAVLIAFGFMLAALMMEELGMIRNAEPVAASVPVQLISAFFGTAGYALMFRSRVKYLPVVAVCGLVTYSVYLWVSSCGISPFFAAFLATMFTTVYSEICARVFHAPSIVFSFSGAISIVPGSGLYYTMKALLFGEGDLVYSNFKGTLLISAGIALGMVTVSILTNGLTRLHKAKKEYIKEDK